MELIRAPLFDTPRNALRFEADGALAIGDGRIARRGTFGELQDAYPTAPVIDRREGFILPGFVDTHVHYPQIRVIGSLGTPLLDWLERSALPEEARMADPAHARRIADHFVRFLVSHGTTTALVFGAHFAEATAALFETAGRAGLRVTSGLVLADQNLRPDLHHLPRQAYDESTALIRRFHGKGRARYCVTPRFALSTSEPMLEVCQTLLHEHDGVLFQTHINEHPAEVAAVVRQFPWAADYLAVYERYGLCSRRSVFAHNVQATDSEIQRMAAHGGSVAHCPCSNAALGSGILRLRRHVAAGVRCALGTDVGAGTGFGIMKEALQAYLLQRVAPDPMILDPAHMLYLSTKAGAEALGLDGETGDLEIGKSADLVYLRPPAGSPLAEALARAESPSEILAALFTLADSSCIWETRVAGQVVELRADR